MTPIRRLVLDVLKPHDPTILAVTRAVAEVDGVEGVNGALREIDEEVRTVKLTLEGEAIDYEAARETVLDMGCTIHSIDEVVCGERMVEESPTHQD